MRSRMRVTGESYTQAMRYLLSAASTAVPSAWEWDSAPAAGATWGSSFMGPAGNGVSRQPARPHPPVWTVRADRDRWAGTIISARQLADAYDIADTDGSRPDCWGYLAAYGWERDDGAGTDDFR